MPITDARFCPSICHLLGSRRRVSNQEHFFVGALYVRRRRDRNCHPKNYYEPTIPIYAKRYRRQLVRSRTRKKNITEIAFGSWNERSITNKIERPGLLRSTLRGLHYIHFSKERTRLLYSVVVQIGWWVSQFWLHGWVCLGVSHNCVILARAVAPLGSGGVFLRELTLST